MMDNSSSAADFDFDSVSAADFLPARETPATLRRAAAVCQGCDLFLQATQVVFGVGPALAALMIIGEIPGDQEDRQGKPFVGPAGRLLDEGLERAKLERRDVYITNAVKHFHWEPRGKRRLHARPKTRHITACRPWWEAEIRVVRPRVVLCLGAVAAQALLGSSFRITRRRGELIESKWAGRVTCSWHPSAVLRAPDEDARQRMRDELFDDIHRAATWSREG